MPWSKNRKRFYPSLSEQPERFWAKVQKRAEHECWPWLGCVAKPQGYGRAGKRGYAHRLAYEIVHGPIPDGLEVRHACDNRICCNPAHLSIGKRKDNVQDMLERGRHYSPFSRAERARHGFAAGGACKP